jgi:succinoglycan biosynthesis protein ExoO
MARVDVVLPVHRAPAGWLRAAAASVRAQDHEDWVLHVVEDGCPERSADALLEAWPVDDERLRFLRLDQQVSQVVARARAVAQGDAPWLALLDQDDEYEPDKLRRQLAAVADGAEVAYVDVAHIDPDGTVLADRTEEAARARRSDTLDGLDTAGRVEALFVGNVLDFPSTLFARSAYDRVGGWDRRFPGGEDWAFWVELAATGSTFTHLARPLYRKRAHPGSDGTRTLDERNLGFLAMAEDLRRRHGIEGPAADQRLRDLRRRAARSALVLGRRARAARLLLAMAAHGQAREVPEVVGQAFRSRR